MKYQIAGFAQNYCYYLNSDLKIMKVILAGYPKTGTKSMAAALRQLGYSVYEYFDYFYHHGDDWMKIMQTGGTTEDLKRMYKDVDAGSDIIFAYYWEELHQAFPDAKIILTTRDEESWYKSMRRQLDDVQNNTMFHLLLIVTPTGRRLYWMMRKTFCLLMGCQWRSPVSYVLSSEMTMKIRYRQHCEYVMKHAPKEKLLVYNVNEGWEPLCKFLGKGVPDTPFPRKNVGATAINEALVENPAMLKMKSEVLTRLCLVSGLGICSAYLAYKRFTWSSLQGSLNNVFSRLFG